MSGPNLSGPDQSLGANVRLVHPRPADQISRWAKTLVTVNAEVREVEMIEAETREVEMVEAEVREVEMGYQP